jgi:putative transposase
LAAKITSSGAIFIKKMVELITINYSRNGKTFEVFIENYLVPELWVGSVVVMDNLPA